MLLSRAWDCRADLIVMGGYGHSQVREIILGGTTREILQELLWIDLLFDPSDAGLGTGRNRLMCALPGGWVDLVVKYGRVMTRENDVRRAPHPLERAEASRHVDVNPRGDRGAPI
jgi:hypothetical protein